MREKKLPFVCGLLVLLWAPKDKGFSYLEDHMLQEKMTESDPIEGKRLGSFRPLSKDQISKVVWKLISSPHGQGIISISSSNTQEAASPVASRVLLSEKLKEKKLKKHPQRHNKNTLHNISEKKISELISKLVSLPNSFPTQTFIDSGPEFADNSFPTQTFIDSGPEFADNSFPPLLLDSVSEKKKVLKWEQRLTKLENTLAAHIKQCSG